MAPCNYFLAISAAANSETRLDCSQLLLRTPLYSVCYVVASSLSRCTEPTENTMFTAPLPNSGYPIVTFTFVAGMCLPSCCLAMGIHVILLYPENGDDKLLRNVVEHIPDYT
jgi:hypothetical protein